ncbi:hypothetical protein EPA93_05450 [Ktedonosporobacter rubrisoli]|uniref:Uncharacterized protein n=1 Tax=Ktedonosporobacter rubrisoli TaxID=2509675 RepID=A0A4P6JLE0_KTERU|nr:hypothetical protein [Ktedonosporobacter rubrisoli]QBD75476.1 hypothetical protein EPA93_05450 [Ktedonosporobacter rubrisoli]
MMNALSSAQQNPQDNHSLAQSTRFSPLVTMVAWIAILLGSAASRVLWVEGLGYRASPHARRDLAYARRHRQDQERRLSMCCHDAFARCAITSSLAMPSEMASDPLRKSID